MISQIHLLAYHGRDLREIRSGRARFHVEKIKIATLFKERMAYSSPINQKKKNASYKNRQQFKTKKTLTWPHHIGHYRDYPPLPSHTGGLGLSAFPALGADNVFLPQVLVGSHYCRCLKLLLEYAFCTNV